KSVACPCESFPLSYILAARNRFASLASSSRLSGISKISCFIRKKTLNNYDAKWVKEPFAKPCVIANGAIPRVVGRAKGGNVPMRGDRGAAKPTGLAMTGTNKMVLQRTL